MIKAHFGDLIIAREYVVHDLIDLVNFEGFILNSMGMNDGFKISHIAI